jgi:hypothetical protein
MPSDESLRAAGTDAYGTAVSQWGLESIRDGGNSGRTGQRGIDWAEQSAAKAVTNMGSLGRAP